MRVTGFNHVTVLVRDLVRSTDFYRCVLGLTPEYVGPGEAHLGRGPVWVCLLQSGEAARAEAGPRIDHVAFTVAREEFEAAVEELRAAGVEVYRGPLRRGGGMTVNFLDPDGNRLELHTGDLWGRVAAWRDAAGYAEGE